MRAYLGLGSNLGDRGSNLQCAVELLRQQVAVVRASHVYETDPVGYAEQPRFWNMVVAIETSLEPRALLDRLIGIEQHMGRERTFRNAPRNIDIDILLYGDVVIDQPGLTIPHPRIGQRAFVLKPLLELAPDLTDPVSRQAYREILDNGEFEHAEVVRPFEE